MPTAEELTVAIKSQGVNETQQDLEGVESSMEDTADSAGESADELSGFSEKFAGAMSAAVAALAVGAAGLLAQVPVLGEAFAGLGAIVQALALQMDSVLRPALSPVTDLFFQIAGGIYEADGAMGAFIGGATTLVSLALVAIPAIAGLGTAFGKFGSTLGGIKTILTGIGGAIKSVSTTIAGFVSGSLAAAAAVGALIGLFGVAILETTGFLNAVRGLGQYVGGGLPAAVVDGLLILSSVFLGIIATIGAAILGFVQGTLEGGLQEGIRQAIARSKEILSTFAGAWMRTIKRIKQALESLYNILGGSGNIGGSLGIDLSGGGGGGGGGGSSTGRPRFASGGKGDVYIDGRQQSESLGRYRSDPARRRGN